MRRRAFTGADALLVAALVLGNGAMFFRGWGGSPAAVEVVTPAGRELVALGAPRRLEARGPLGITVIRVDAEGARVESSPCGLQLCVRTGRVTRPGQVVACLPNRVAVLVRGSGPGGVDAVGR